MYAFIDTSGDMNSKEEQYVVTTAAVIRKAKIPSLLSQIYNLKKGILENERQEIKAQSFINASTLAQNGEPFSKKYTFILSFSDEDNYKKIRSEIYNNRDKIIVIAGKWESSGEYNKFTSKVYGAKQVAIIK